MRRSGEFRFLVVTADGAAPVGPFKRMSRIRPSRTTHCELHAAVPVP